MIIIEVEDRTIALTRQLLSIWEGSVRLTHTFLSESEIERIKAYVQDAIGKVAHLVVSVNEEDKPIAFIGIEENKIEMLFVHAELRGKGIGKQLIHYAISHYDAEKVTVNEQNPLAIGFYKHLGFRTYMRTDLDEEGNPYPLLYMSLQKS